MYFGEGAWKAQAVDLFWCVSIAVRNAAERSRHTKDFPNHLAVAYVFCCVNLLGNLQGVNPIQEADEYFVAVGHVWNSGFRSKETECVAWMPSIRGIAPGDLSAYAWDSRYSGSANVGAFVKIASRGGGSTNDVRRGHSVNTAGWMVRQGLEH